MAQWRGGTNSTKGAVESVAVAGCRVSDCRPTALLATLDEPRFAWVTEDRSLLGGGTATTLVAAGADRFSEIRTAGRALLSGIATPDDLPAVARPRLYGGFAFHDDHEPDANVPWKGFPAAKFVLPAVQIARSADETWVTVAAAGPDAGTVVDERLKRWRDRIGSEPEPDRTDLPGIETRRPSPDRQKWIGQVTSALDRIRDGPLRKVVLAGSLSLDLETSLPVSPMLERLGSVYPDCTRFAVAPERGGTFFGATPERLVAVEGTTAETAVLAGSMPRGATTDEDDRLARKLRSEKVVDEHEVVTEAVLDKLDSYAADLDVDGKRTRKLSNVQHLETPVRARLDRDYHVLELVEALHPTPAVGGMPQDLALRTVRETEAFDRGWYASPVGWFDGEGDGDFSVALRSGLVRGNSLSLFAGNGIVAESDPDAEWRELQLKYRPILDELA